MSRNVLIIQRRMTEYRVPLFDALRRGLAEHGVTLHVIYGDPTGTEEVRQDSGTLKWGIRVQCHYFRLWRSYLVWQNIPRKIFYEQDLVIITHENSLLANYLLLLSRTYRHVPQIAFWGHGANFQSQSPHSMRNRLKVWTARQVDWWFAYTAASVEKVVESGFPTQQITCLNNSIDVGALTMWQTSITASERQALLQGLGLAGTCIAVFIGGLYREKRLEFLFASADEIRSRLPDFELLIIGDGPQRDLVQSFAETRSWCRWVGARHGRDKALYVSLCQVILNPGLVGLNILDSFTFGLPLLTTDCHIHSPEIAYLRSGQNGIMTSDGLTSYVDAIEQILTDEKFREKLAENARADAARYSLENMVDNFTTGILQALGQSFPTASRYSPPTLHQSPVTSHLVQSSPQHVVIIWQRFLPYHRARIRQTRQRLAALGHSLTAIEVASQDSSYGFDQENKQDAFTHICCFPDSSYHDHTAAEINSRVKGILLGLKPDVVFAPATPFPEGMAADAYRLVSDCRRILMDDAWEHTDRRGRLTKAVKRIIHHNIDGALIPALSHRGYYENMGFPSERILFGLDVVDNDFYQLHADQASTAADILRIKLDLPEHFFLFVGRFLPRKGLETLLAAFDSYRTQVGDSAWDLVLVGGGSHEGRIRELALQISGVRFIGVVTGEKLCNYYGLAHALVVPSDLDPWGLVVNEALAAGLPVLASQGCGATANLIIPGENGWTFKPDDSGELAILLFRMSQVSNITLQQMGERSREIIANWSLDCFADGVIKALDLSRRNSGGILSDTVVRLWKGRVSVN